MDMHKGLIRPYSSLLVQANRIADIIWIFLGLYIALLPGTGWVSEAAWLGLIAAVLFAICAESGKLYRSWRVAPLHDELSVIWRSWLVTALITISILYFLDNLFGFDKATLLQWLLIVPVLLSVSRAIVRLVLRASRRAGRNFRIAAIVGANDIGRRVAQRLISSRWMGIRVLGYFDQRSPGKTRPLADSPVPLVGSFDDLFEKAKNGEIDIVYITLPMRAEIRVRQLIEELADTMVQVNYVADFILFDLLHTRWGSLGDIPVLMTIDSPFRGFNGFTKRIQDICLASALLALCALPMLAIVIAIKLTSPGPVIYRQNRHGLDGSEFSIYKFRTMSMQVCCDDYKQATRDDHRVTSLGRFLRRTSLDELPQLINVLQGRMSLVGPRPHPLLLNEQHKNLIRHFALRHKVRPGITGWAQVNGCRGETETLEKMQRRIEYDLEYINNWSIWLDMRILILTMVRVWQDRNAY